MSLIKNIFGVDGLKNNKKKYSSGYNTNVFQTIYKSTTFIFCQNQKFYCNGGACDLPYNNHVVVFTT